MGVAVVALLLSGAEFTLQPVPEGIGVQTGDRFRSLNLMTPAEELASLPYINAQNINLPPSPALPACGGHPSHHWHGLLLSSRRK